MQKSWAIFGVALGALAWSFMSGCAAGELSGAGNAAPGPQGTPVLTFFHTSTVTSTPPPPDPSTPTALPTATATPRTHTVQGGEEMLAIALRYGLTLEQLRAANPEVDPAVMPIGVTLIIPDPGGAAAPALELSPTPGGIALGGVTCSPDSSSGAWCFTLANNLLDQPLESVSVEIRVVDVQNGESRTQTAAAPLNLLLPGMGMPLAAYFPAPFPRDFQASASLLTALPAAPGDGRYVAARVENLRVEIAPDGLSTEINGDIFLEGDASLIWILGVTWNEAGQVVGLRRLALEGQNLAGVSVPFSLNVYSSSSPALRAEVLVEARP